MKEPVKDMDTRIRIKDQSILSFYEEMARKESQRRSQHVSRNQIIIEVLTSYMNQYHSVENPLLLSLEDKIDQQSTLIKELIELIRDDFIPSIQNQNQTYHQILETSLQLKRKRMMQTQHQYVIQLNEELETQLQAILNHDGVSDSNSFSAQIRYVIHQYHQRLSSMITEPIPLGCPKAVPHRYNSHLYEEDIQRLSEIQVKHQWPPNCTVSRMIQTIILRYWKIIQTEPPSVTTQVLTTPNDFSISQRQELSQSIHQIRESQKMSLAQWGKQYGVSKVGAWYWEHGSRPGEKILNQMKRQYHLDLD